MTREEWTLIRNARQLLTLRGPSGARRGPALSDLAVIPYGSVLIRNGVIEEVGPARRVENLAGAKRAIEIDAAGKIVLPAFVDAATTLVDRPESASIRTMSKPAVNSRVAAAAARLARSGCLTIGARTTGSDDLRNITKILRAHQAHQSRPLRIRSVVAPRLPDSAPDSPQKALDLVLAKWLPHVRNRKLAIVVEFDLADFQPPEAMSAARAAAGLGFTIRFRSPHAPDPAGLRLALDAGAISFIAPSDADSALSRALSDSGCIRVFPAREIAEPTPSSRANVRAALSSGAAIALASDAHADASLPHLAALAVHHLGLSPEEAITATTWNPAAALRFSSVTGSLEPGKSADLLVMAVSDYRDLFKPPGPAEPVSSDVALSIRAGRVVWRADKPSRH